MRNKRMQRSPITITDMQISQLTEQAMNGTWSDWVRGCEACLEQALFKKGGGSFGSETHPHKKNLDPKFG